MKKSLIKYAVIGLSVLSIKGGASASDFNANFNDSTLRIDYILAGGPQGAQIYLESSSKQKGWAGRKNKLKETPIAGNGTIFVMNPLTGDTLYMNSFSTLFQEWILTQEASETPHSFENSFLVPLPKKEADIIMELRDNRRQTIARLKHKYRPDDELVAIVGQNPLPHIYLYEGKNGEDVIDIAFVAEGFREEEMDTFVNRAKLISEEILSYEPFASNKEKFRFVAVKTPSEESGVSVPLKKDWKNTAFGSHFSTFYSPRYLTVPRVKKLHQSLEGIPYEHIFVLVNTPEYGGGGIYNSYQVATTDHPYTLPVAVHEFGHSFAGLADEYFYAGEEDDTYLEGIEPWEKNITTLIDFNSKWAHKLSEGTVIPTPWNKEVISREKNMEKAKREIPSDIKIGVYEGAGYRSTGVYRAFVTCRMRDNEYPAFCEVCEDALREVIEFYTSE